jgi:uncharacterized membrane protein
MWILELALTTLWMAGIAFGFTMGGFVHVLAFVVVALVFTHDTPFERKPLGSRFARKARITA